jgi:hypothetical protein
LTDGRCYRADMLSLLRSISEREVKFVKYWTVDLMMSMSTVGRISSEMIDIGMPLVRSFDLFFGGASHIFDGHPPQTSTSPTPCFT